MYKFAAVVVVVILTAASCFQLALAMGLPASQLSWGPIHRSPARGLSMGQSCGDRAAGNCGMGRDVTGGHHASRVQVYRH